MGTPADLEALGSLPCWVPPGKPPGPGAARLCGPSSPSRARRRTGSTQKLIKFPPTTWPAPPPPPGALLCGFSRTAGEGRECNYGAPRSQLRGASRLVSYSFGCTASRRVGGERGVGAARAGGGLRGGPGEKAGRGDGEAGRREEGNGAREREEEGPAGAERGVVCLRGGEDARRALRDAERCRCLGAARGPLSFSGGAERCSGSKTPCASLRAVVRRVGSGG